MYYVKKKVKVQLFTCFLGGLMCLHVSNSPSSARFKFLLFEAADAKLFGFIVDLKKRKKWFSLMKVEKDCWTVGELMHFTAVFIQLV